MGPKDLGNQQSRFKWMMEGQTSPDTASPDNAFHKNGWFLFFPWKIVFDPAYLSSANGI